MCERASYAEIISIRESLQQRENHRTIYIQKKKQIRKYTTIFIYNNQLKKINRR